jgi:DNA primase
MAIYIEEIKQRLKPSQIISRRVALKRRGVSTIGLCPFHNETTPSFHVHDDKGYFYCFGCGASGDIFDFVMRTEGLDFPETLKKLADEAGVVLPERKPEFLLMQQQLAQQQILYAIYQTAAQYYQLKLRSYVGDGALEYLKNRGIDEDVMQTFSLGFAPMDGDELIQLLSSHFSKEDLLRSGVLKSGRDGRLTTFFFNRVMFPIFDLKDRVIAFGGRALDGGNPKYLNSAESEIFIKSQHLYNWGYAMRRYRANHSTPIVLVEGYMDVIALHQAGIATAVAPMGTAFKNSQLQIMWQVCPNPVLLFDNDVAGHNALNKAVYHALPEIGHQKSLQIGSIHKFKDPDELLRQRGAGALLEVVQNAEAMSEYLFRHEIESKPHRTAEQKLDLEKRLQAVVSQIKDRDMQRQYQMFFKDKIWEITRVKSKPLSAMEHTLSNASIVELMQKPDPLLELISAVVMLYPQLLLVNSIFEDYTALNLGQNELQVVRTELLAGFEKIGRIPLNKEQTAEKFALLSQNLQQKFPNFSLLAAEVVDYEGAFSYAIRLLKLVSLNKLNDEIERMSQKILREAEDMDFQQFAELRKIQETLKLELGVI